MELTFSQIKAFTSGAVSVTQTEQGICFDRYTPSQIRAFGVQEEVQGLWAQSTTGVRIDFHTDAQALTVVTSAIGKYEVLVDGLTAFVQRFEGPDSFTVALEAGEHRLTIVLPSHDRGCIVSVWLEKASFVQAHSYSKKLVFHGDSITQGFDSAKDSQSYVWLVSRYYDADSLILGVGGSRFFPDTVEDVGFNPDAAVVALGTNDWGANQDMELIRCNCAAYLDRIAELYVGKPVFCVTPIWRGNGMEVNAAGCLNDVRRMIVREAEQRNMIVVDGLSLVPHRPEYFADEYLHPNDLGFALYAQNLLKVMNRHL